MNKILIVFGALTLFFVFKAKGQIFSPNLNGYIGYATISSPGVIRGVPLSIYQGNIVNGVAQGWGTWYFANGNIFQGYFQNGLPNGAGIFLSFRGYQTGCWLNGNYVGPCQQRMQQLYRDRNYGGVGDALAEVSDEAPDDYNVDENNYQTQKTRRGERVYGGGFN